MQTAFNCPVLTVQGEPLFRGELLGRTTGNQGDGFCLMTLDFSAKQGGLFNQREANLFGDDGVGLEEPFFSSLFIDFRTGSLVGRIDLQGGKPPVRREPLDAHCL